MGAEVSGSREESKWKIMVLNSGQKVTSSDWSTAHYVVKQDPAAYPGWPKNGLYCVQDPMLALIGIQQGEINVAAGRGPQASVGSIEAGKCPSSFQTPAPSFFSYTHYRPKILM